MAFAYFSEELNPSGFQSCPGVKINRYTGTQGYQHTGIKNEILSQFILINNYIQHFMHDNITYNVIINKYCLVLSDQFLHA